MFYLTPIVDEIFSTLFDTNFYNNSYQNSFYKIKNFDTIDVIFEQLRKRTELPPIAPNYPVTNISFLEDGTLELEIAVTGFSKDELNIYVEDDIFTIKGIKNNVNNDVKRKYLHHKLVCKNFEVKYHISDKYDIENPIIELSNGLLKIKFNFKPELQPKRKMLEISEK